MIIQNKKDWFKVGTKADHPWTKRDVTVFKRISAFNWKELELNFDTVEQAVEFVKFSDAIGELQ